MNSAPGTTSSIGITSGECATHDGDGLLLFDADCPFCRRSVRWLLAHERPDSQLRIAGLKSAVARRLGTYFQIDFAGTDSIWYIAESELSRNSDAAWRLATRLRGGWQRLDTLRWIPRPLREGGYRFIGNHRHRLASGSHAHREEEARLEGHERWADTLSPELCRRCGLPSDLAADERYASTIGAANEQKR